MEALRRLVEVLVAGHLPQYRGAAGRQREVDLPRCLALFLHLLVSHPLQEGLLHAHGDIDSVWSARRPRRQDALRRTLRCPSERLQRPR
eukprot:61678-Pyramimonas_sp.AAC.1